MFNAEVAQAQRTRREVARLCSDHQPECEASIGMIPRQFCPSARSAMWAAQAGLVIGLLLPLVVGSGPACRPRRAVTPPATPSAPNAAAPPLPLRVVTLDDPPLSQAMAREWQANAQEPTEFETLPSATLASEALRGCRRVSLRVAGADGDDSSDPAVAGPDEFGDGTTRDISTDDEDYDWNDVFPWLRRRELRWGKQLYGVSFGSPQLLLLYRSDLLAEWSLAPPTTWQEYGQLTATIQQRIAAAPDGPLRFATLEPLADGWAARTLLARAATYARHPNQYSTLFQFTTMKPWIDQPPFVRALEELVRDVGTLPSEARALGPDPIMRRLLAGESAMAITWPSSARPAAEGVAPQAAFAILPLPGATEVYQMADQTWQTRTDQQRHNVPLLGVAGRMGAVARRARSPEAARNFLMWVTRADASVRISTESPATTLFRTTQTARPQAWVESALAPAAGQFAAALLANQQQSSALMMPRIPAQGAICRRWTRPYAKRSRATWRRRPHCSRSPQPGPR